MKIKQKYKFNNFNFIPALSIGFFKKEAFDYNFGRRKLLTFLLPFCKIEFKKQVYQ